MKNAVEAPETVLVFLAGHARMPMPSSQERAEFVASLESASARIKNGEYTLFEREKFLEALRQDYAKHHKIE